ncbi:MAG: class I SAM-dependent rRNA methyltransferase [Clostridia bacterium]|nr:class I SAM-dependent rRNA methyltransferase [Clostridia bacterium]
MLSLPTVFITEKGERHARSGHPWVFEGEVVRTADNPADGELAHVFTEPRNGGKAKFIGTGYYNSHSKIRVRLISTNANDKFDEEFYRRRLKYALDYRKTVMGDDFRASRLIFGEADQFPGLTVDLFEDVLSVQTLSLGTEKIKDMLLTQLCELLPEYGVNVRAVYERNDVNIRTLEGMETFTGYWKAENFPEKPADGHVIITENGIRYDVDFINGQKTGFFLDQKYNRLAAAKLAKGRRVLDCFTHTGAFALNCAAGGAEHVTAVDISALAIEQTRKNAALNGLTDKMDFVNADVFKLLTDMVNEKRRDYDFIILDPPAFTKSGDTVKDAFRGYKDINMRAMRCLPRGGYLATCSCSHFMKDELFQKMLDEAAHDAGVTLRQIEVRAQSPDHPILRTGPEKFYLKFYTFQVV